MFSASKYIYFMWLQTSSSSYVERMLSTSAMRGFSVHTTLLTEIQKLSSLTIPRIDLWSAHGQSKQNSEWPWIKATDVHSHGATWHLISLPERLCAFTEQKQDWLHGCQHKNTKQPPPPHPTPPHPKKTTVSFVSSTLLSSTQYIHILAEIPLQKHDTFLSWARCI